MSQHTLDECVTLIRTPGAKITEVTLMVIRAGESEARPWIGSAAVAQAIINAYFDTTLPRSAPPAAEAPTARAAAARLLPWRQHLPGISVRLYNILNYAGVQTIGDIEKLGGKALLKLPNCGATSVREARTLLAEHGITLSHG